MFGDGHCCVDVIQHDLSAFAANSSDGPNARARAAIDVMIFFMLLGFKVSVTVVLVLVVLQPHIARQSRLAEAPIEWDAVGAGRWFDCGGKWFVFGFVHRII